MKRRSYTQIGGRYAGHVLQAEARCRLCCSRCARSGSRGFGPSAQLDRESTEQFLCRPGNERPNGRGDRVRCFGAVRQGTGHRLDRKSVV